MSVNYRNINKFILSGDTASLKALFSLNSLFEQISFNINKKLKLFEHMILPILNNGAEVWGFHKAPNVEKVYLKFLKHVLIVRQQTTMLQFMENKGALHWMYTVKNKY